MNLFYATTFASAAIVAIPALFKSDRRERTFDFNIAAFFASYPIVFGTSMYLCEALRRQTYDATLYRADRSLGLDAFAWIRIVYAHHWLFEAMIAVYVLLPIVMALGWVIERSIPMLIAMGVAPVFALGIYLIVPAVGPMHAFSRGTLLPLDAVAHLVRNCFPSMHLTWALLVALNARKRYWKAFAWSFVALTCMATIGSGEHYVVDLIAAVPFCLAVQALTEKRFALSYAMPSTATGANQ